MRNFRFSIFDFRSNRHLSFNRQSTIGNRQFCHRRGQVLVEFALATIGVLVLAFVCGKVVKWMNDTLVYRNRAYQNTRVEAGTFAKQWSSKDAITPFADDPNTGPIEAGPPLLHLLGTEAESLLGEPEQSRVPPVDGEPIPPGAAKSARMRDCEGWDWETEELKSMK